MSLKTLLSDKSQNKLVVSGKKLFWLMDTKGLPLIVINEYLREHNAYFNVCEFVDCAIASKNFTYEKIKARLVEESLPIFRQAIIIELDRWYKSKCDIKRNEPKVADTTK